MKSQVARNRVNLSEAHTDFSTYPLSSPAVGPSPPTSAADASAELEQLAGLTPPVAVGRGVLHGAFAVLDALARADEGLGLTELARADGLAKTSAHRLAEHLVALGAVQCVDHRYY